MRHTYGTVQKCVVNSRISRVGQMLRRFVLGLVCILVVFAGQACHDSEPTPAKTLTVIDQGWIAGTDYQHRLNEAVANFTRQTGISVEFLPAPETALEQIATWHKLLEGGTS